MDNIYINRVLDGDINAFEFLIKKYQNQSYSIAISIVKNHELAKDVVQESFIKAYTSLKNFRRESKFSTWFFKILINTALKLVQNEKRLDKVPMDSVVEIEDRRALNDSIKQLEKSDLKKLINEVFELLPSKEAMILQLYYIEDMNINEIVTVTSLSKNYIKVLLHRGRNGFYDILKNKNINKPY